MTTSHWQAGCNDGKHSRGPKRPYPNAESFGSFNAAQADANADYMQGHRAGVEMRKAAEKTEATS